MFTRAAQYTLEDLAAIFTASFEGYFYPGTTTALDLARRVRHEQLDLWYSPVLLQDGRPIGLALLGLRGERAWCGGFGIYAAARGQGLAHTLASALLANAREAGVTTLDLEVLTRNSAALHVYQRTGMAIWRDLLIVEWRRPETWQPQPVPHVEAVQLADVLPVFAALHQAQPAWQRDLPTLLAMQNLRGLAIRRGGQISAYLLYTGSQGERLRIVDLAATSSTDAELLLQALQGHAPLLVSVNEPSDSQLTAAYLACGFSEIDRQHEMMIDLV